MRLNKKSQIENEFPNTYVDEKKTTKQQTIQKTTGYRTASAAKNKLNQAVTPEREISNEHRTSRVQKSHLLIVIDRVKYYVGLTSRNFVQLNTRIIYHRTETQNRRLQVDPPPTPIAPDTVFTET